MQLFIIRILLLVLVVLGTSHSPKDTDTYRVIYVRGKIMDVSQDKYLRPKMDLFEKDSLYFEDNNSLAVLTSATRGRFILKPHPTQSKENQENWKEAREILWQALYPLNVQHRIVRRSAQPEISDLPAYTGDSVFCIIGDHLRVRVRETEYDLSNPERYFALRYRINTKDYYRKIPSRDQIIEFSPQNFAAEDGKLLDPSSLGMIDLYFVEDNKPKIISSFQLMFLDEREIKASFDVIREIEADSIPPNPKEKYKYYQQAFFEIYGQTDFWYLERWLRKNSF